MTWRDTDRHARRLLVVPVGSLEQHGPHLPLDCDSRVALAVATAAAERVGGGAVTPVIPFGVSGEHRDFPGTVSIGAAALSGVLVELTRHASRDWRTILVVNGHGGNRDALADAARRCADEGRALIVYHAAWTDGDAHAGLTETSLLLHLDPTSVRMDRAEPGNRAPLSRLMPTLRTAGVRTVSPNGVLGDPLGATAAHGRDVFEELVARVVETAG